jgi:polyhydroxyalkanoate synthesis repressor PhaR
MGGGKNVSDERLIKRYENRKLYDTRARRYVTLDGVAHLVMLGEDVRVIDQASGRDITSTVLAQVIFERVRQQTADVPKHLLAQLIRLGSAPSRALDWGVPQKITARARGEAERIVAELIKRGQLTLDEALALRKEISEAVNRAVSEAHGGFEARLAGLLPSFDSVSVGPALQGIRSRISGHKHSIEEEKWRNGRHKAKPSRRARAARR